MWNSNSVISWLLVHAGVGVDAIRPPAGGRAPGWDAGLVVARRAGGHGSEASEDTFVIPNPRRVAVIESEVDIARSPEEVFDYCSDPANELQWNIKMRRIEKLTEEPLRVGTRYKMEFVTGPPVIAECGRFDRPSAWEMFGGSRMMRSGWRGRVLEKRSGAHLILRMEIELRGMLGLATPILRRRMHPELERDIATIKATLEGGEPPQERAGDR
jgi:Polyketide cyclase / dehydrase and lipid transport